MHDTGCLVCLCITLIKRQLIDHVEIRGEKKRKKKKRKWTGGGSNAGLFAVMQLQSEHSTTELRAHFWLIPAIYWYMRVISNKVNHLRPPRSTPYSRLSMYFTNSHWAIKKTTDIQYYQQSSVYIGFNVKFVQLSCILGLYLERQDFPAVATMSLKKK